MQEGRRLLERRVFWCVRARIPSSPKAPSPTAVPLSNLLSNTNMCANCLSADFNECSAGGCVAAATACNNTPGNFTCTCPAGWTGDGKTAAYGGTGCAGGTAWGKCAVAVLRVARCCCTYTQASKLISSLHSSTRRCVFWPHCNSAGRTPCHPGPGSSYHHDHLVPCWRGGDGRKEAGYCQGGQGHNFMPMFVWLLG